MNSIRLLIVDDEPLAHNILQNYCNKMEYVEVIGHCYDGVSTINFLNDNQVDALLLDIQMPDITGIELLETLKNNSPKVIFTTAYTDFALQGFEYDQVVDYLHKPVRLARFIKAIARLKKQLTLEKGEQKQPFINQKDALVKEISDFMSIKDNKIIHKFKIADIVYIQSWGNYLKIFFQNDEMKVVRKTIKAMEGKLSEKQFERIHKSYLININHVSSIEGNEVVINKQRLPIGKSYQMKAKYKITC